MQFAGNFFFIWNCWIIDEGFLNCAFLKKCIDLKSFYIAGFLLWKLVNFF